MNNFHPHHILRSHHTPGVRLRPIVVRLVLASGFLLLVTGCIPILIHAAAESSSRERTAYSAYRDTQLKINSDREIAGLPPQPVFTLKEWRATVGRSTNAPLATPRSP